MSDHDSVLVRRDGIRHLRGLLASMEPKGEVDHEYWCSAMTILNAWVGRKADPSTQSQPGCPLDDCTRYATCMRNVEGPCVLYVKPPAQNVTAQMAHGTSPAMGGVWEPVTATIPPVTWTCPQTGTYHFNPVRDGGEEGYVTKKELDVVYAKLVHLADSSREHWDTPHVTKAELDAAEGRCDDRMDVISDKIDTTMETYSEEHIIEYHADVAAWRKAWAEGTICSECARIQECELKPLVICAAFTGSHPK